MVELLITIVILAIFAGLMIQSSSPILHEQLIGAAQVLVSDLDYARHLAVDHNSTYRVSFEALDQYTLRHTGTNSTLDQLPHAPFRSRDDADTEHVTRFSDLPGIGLSIQVYDPSGPSNAAPPAATQYVEFGSLGNTTPGSANTIWLVGGTGNDQRFISIAINSVTGLATVGDVTSEVPNQGSAGSLSPGAPGGGSTLPLAATFRSGIRKSSGLCCRGRNSREFRYMEWLCFSEANILNRIAPAGAVSP